MLWTVVGITAASLTSSGFIPQLIKGLRTRQLTDVSTGTLVTMILGTALWAFYGWHREDAIILGANIFTSSCITLILILKFRFDAAGRGQPSKP